MFGAHYANCVRKYAIYRNTKVASNLKTIRENLIFLKFVSYADFLDSCSRHFRIFVEFERTVFRTKQNT